MFFYYMLLKIPCRRFVAQTSVTYRARGLKVALFFETTPYDIAAPSPCHYHFTFTHRLTTTLPNRQFIITNENNDSFYTMQRN